MNTIGRGSIPFAQLPLRVAGDCPSSADRRELSGIPSDADVPVYFEVRTASFVPAGCVCVSGAGAEDWPNAIDRLRSCSVAAFAVIEGRF